MGEIDRQTAFHTRMSRIRAHSQSPIGCSCIRMGKVCECDPWGERGSGPGEVAGDAGNAGEGNCEGEKGQGGARGGEGEGKAEDWVLCDLKISFSMY